jgi:hypothetical protein
MYVARKYFSCLVSRDCIYVPQLFAPKDSYWLASRKPVPRELDPEKSSRFLIQPSKQYIRIRFDGKGGEIPQNGKVRSGRGRSQDV